MQHFDAAATACLLDHAALVSGLSDVLIEYQEARIVSPGRLAVSCNDGLGILLSMPCSSHDLIIHKLLTIYNANREIGLPAIHGNVICFNARNGVPLFSLDGPTVTSRRTAALTMIGIQHLRPSVPDSLLLIGTGAQAAAHVEAARVIFPDMRIYVQARSDRQAEAFCQRAGAPGLVLPADASALSECTVVVAVTSSTTPVYTEESDPNRLVVGVGSYRLDMVEIGSRLINGSQVYIDDVIGGQNEAGDLVSAGTDWKTVKPLAKALMQAVDYTRPIFLKSVGCAAWDLAACRTVRVALSL
jgi:1-piperideine-2-carboxylate/1-pyrroline-2-carboxylate reductase [NAD(P)H]